MWNGLAFACATPSTRMESDVLLLTLFTSSPPAVGFLPGDSYRSHLAAVLVSFITLGVPVHPLYDI
jgi:hypothetical protein